MAGRVLADLQPLDELSGARVKVFSLERVFEFVFGSGSEEKTVRTYQEPIAVRFGEAPEQFIWRGRLLLVKEIQSLVRQAAPWWRAPSGENLLQEREVWRLEAGNGVLGRGVYELARTVGAEDWVLQAVMD